MPTLDWLNRNAAFKLAKDVPYRLLEAVSQHRTNVTAPTVKALLHGGKVHENTNSRLDLFSASEPALNKADSEKPVPTAAAATHDNLLIQGDNLEALKALLPFYRGQVKCIFIDPPYNTKSAFEHYDDNLEHAQWLSMMLPRLQLLRELLSEDGSIWVTIDDNEGHYLKVLMDEVFGRGNFITNIIWCKNYAPKSSARHFSEDHDYVTVFAKNSETWTPNLMPRSDKQDKAYRNPDNDKRGLWRPNNSAARNFYSKGIYAIACPGGRVVEDPPAGSYWRVSEDKFRQMDADGRIWWGREGNNVPAPKILFKKGDHGESLQAQIEALFAPADRMSKPC
jgi:16S rRNA G966 N2-methylase RsmD